MTSATPSSDDDAAVTTPFNYNVLLSVLGPARIDFCNIARIPERMTNTVPFVNGSLFKSKPRPANRTSRKCFPRGPQV